MKVPFKSCLTALVMSFFFADFAFSQTSSSSYNINGGNNTSITTAMPFLVISPDARSGAMGDVGVALSPDANSSYWNPAKLANLNSNSSISVSYSPWLRKLVSDINLAYLSYSKKLDDRNSLGLSLRYFNFGSISLYDENAVSQGTYHPNQFSLDGSFARSFGENFSMGLTLRYIHSSLLDGSVLGSQQANAANSLAADVSLFSSNQTSQFGNDAIFAFGLNISNIGTKIRYYKDGPQYFLPANLKLGVANTLFLDDLNKLTIALDANKLLVPTPPIRDSNGNIVQGVDDNRSFLSGIFGSFSDAPGGFKEELQEISYSSGLEYWYNDQFALRAGYFYENPNKGNRQYLTLGFGLKYSDFNLDMSYIAANQNKSPLANTLRFSVSYNIGSTNF